MEAKTISAEDQYRLRRDRLRRVLSRAGIDSLCEGEGRAMVVGEQGSISSSPGSHITLVSLLTNAPILPAKHPPRHTAAPNPPALDIGPARLPVAVVERAVERLDGRDPELKGARLVVRLLVEEHVRGKRGGRGEGGRGEDGGGSGGAGEGDLRLLAFQLSDDGRI